MMSASVQQPLGQGHFPGTHCSSCVVMRTARMRMQDEVYHVRQTQRFCTGSLQYDPMITTFPGVYVVGVIWSQALRLISWALALLYSTPPLPMVSVTLQDHATHCSGTALLSPVHLHNSLELPNSLTIVSFCNPRSEGAECMCSCRQWHVGRWRCGR